MFFSCNITAYQVLPLYRYLFLQIYLEFSGYLLLYFTIFVVLKKDYILKLKSRNWKKKWLILDSFHGPFTCLFWHNLQVPLFSIPILTMCSLCLRRPDRNPVGIFSLPILSLDACYRLCVLFTFRIIISSLLFNVLLSNLCFTVSFNICAAGCRVNLILLRNQWNCIFYIYYILFYIFFDIIISNIMF